MTNNTVTMSLELAERLALKPERGITDPCTIRTLNSQFHAALDELRALLAAPIVEADGMGEAVASVVERQPFRFLVKSCHGPRSKSIEDADESMRESIESARQYFGAENEIDADKAKSLVYISPGEWFAIPLYTSPPAPVSVVLPEPMKDPGMIAGLTSRYAQGFNACLQLWKESLK